MLINSDDINSDDITIDWVTFEGHFSYCKRLHGSIYQHSIYHV